MGCAKNVILDAWKCRVLRRAAWKNLLVRENLPEHLRERNYSISEKWVKQMSRYFVVSYLLRMPKVLRSFTWVSHVLHPFFHALVLGALTCCVYIYIFACAPPNIFSCIYPGICCMHPRHTFFMLLTPLTCTLCTASIWSNIVVLISIRGLGARRPPIPCITRTSRNCVASSSILMWKPIREKCLDRFMGIWMLLRI